MKANKRYGTQAQAAKQYGVSSIQIRKIWNGERWGHVTGHMRDCVREAKGK